MKSTEIRHAFVEFFQNKGHTYVESSSLVPHNDPTLLFTNSGMVPFKNYFLRLEQPPATKVVSFQRCVRAGGKHNDLENVGYTARHHTFFEMLGNFSFGEYFKSEAIAYCWEFLTHILLLPKEKLWITVHHNDDEARDIWVNEIGIEPQRISALDEDNFWKMGNTGPCGPCSEVFYDHGSDIFGDPPGGENDDGDRFIEIWNLVFMQYEQLENGQLIPLPKPCVDTGMGLERIAAVLQGVHNNYDIDIFRRLLQSITILTQGKLTNQQSLKVIADHVRSSYFLIADGVFPSNEGRGYVLRRIIRRALRHGHKEGVSELFFYKLGDELVEEMGDAYPLLLEHHTVIKQTLKREEELFNQTLSKGLVILQDALRDMVSQTIPGEIIFKLFDTYGFPVDLTNDIALEKGLTLDMQGYEQCMKKQKELARSSHRFTSEKVFDLTSLPATHFVGYHSNTAEVKLLALLNEKGEHCSSLGIEQVGYVVLEQTPFYAEAGGQVGDCGYVWNGSGRFHVNDCQKQGDVFVHKGEVLEGIVQLEQNYSAAIDISFRKAVAINHSATHLLHATLKNIVGAHITQKGSLVDSKKLRFDFSQDSTLTNEQLMQINVQMNQQIQLCSNVVTETMGIDEAMKQGAMALFSEKYADQVRVLSMGQDDENKPYSIELCGGTHVTNTAEIGAFIVVAQSSVAAGIRRLEAITSTAAITLLLAQQSCLVEVQKLTQSTQAEVLPTVQGLIDKQRQLQKQIEKLRLGEQDNHVKQWLTEAIETAKGQVLIKQVTDVDSKGLKLLLDQLKSNIQSGIIVLSSLYINKVLVVISVSPVLSQEFSAKDIMQVIATAMEGKGGGSAEMAQGGSGRTDLLSSAQDEVQRWLLERMES